jgi:hypothetical protein
LPKGENAGQKDSRLGPHTGGFAEENESPEVTRQAGMTLKTNIQFLTPCGLCRLSDNSKNEPFVILSEAKNLMLSESYKTRFFGYHLRMTIAGQPVCCRVFTKYVV